MTVSKRHRDIFIVNKLFRAKLACSPVLSGQGRKLQELFRAGVSFPRTEVMVLRRQANSNGDVLLLLLLLRGSTVATMLSLLVSLSLLPAFRFWRVAQLGTTARGRGEGTYIRAGKARAHTMDMLSSFLVSCEQERQGNMMWGGKLNSLFLPMRLSLHVRVWKGPRASPHAADGQSAEEYGMLSAHPCLSFTQASTSANKNSIIRTHF